MAVPPVSLFAPPSRLQRTFPILLLVLTVVFGVYTAYRSAFLQERKSDLNVYLRAAWAVRAGESPYDFCVIDTLGFRHYNYPPLLAILLSPLADKPAGVDGAFAVPFAVSVILWYVVSVLALGWAAHLLASALEQTSTDPTVRGQPRGCRRWWALRLFPLLFCLPGIARTLVVGQVDLLVVLLLCGMTASALRGQSWRAGLWLAGAVCIKLIPAFLLIYPLWRRDLRWLGGCAVGLVLCCVVLPVAALGPSRAWAYQRQWAEVVMLPGLGMGQDHTRESDLTGMAHVHSQSLVAVLHAFQYPNRDLRPAHPSRAASVTALLAASVLVVLTLAAARRLRGGSHAAVALGALVLVMLMLSPICHPHYFCHWLPLTAGLMHFDMERRQNRSIISLGLFTLLTVCMAANALTSVPGLDLLRDRGLATAAELLLWAAGVVVLWRFVPRTMASATGAVGAAPEAALTHRRAA